MSPIAKENLTLACFFNNMAKHLYLSAAHEMQYQGKKAMNVNVSRCQANENDVMAQCANDAARAHFRKEIMKGDTLLFGNIITEMLHMTVEQREAVEEMICAIGKGELIEVMEPINEAI